MIVLQLVFLHVSNDEQYLFEISLGDLYNYFLAFESFLDELRNLSVSTCNNELFDENFEDGENNLNCASELQNLKLNGNIYSV